MIEQDELGFLSSICRISPRDLLDNTGPWVDGIEIVKTLPNEGLKNVECNLDNYPNCGKITLIEAFDYSIVFILSGLLMIPAVLVLYQVKRKELEKS